MSVVDEVAGLPGGQPLAALAAQVQGSPAAARNLANRWSRAAIDTAASTAAVDGALSRVSQTWRGSSNAAFTDLMSQFGRASGGAQQSLSNAAATLNRVAVAFEQVQNSINMICENLLIRVSQVRTANPGAAAGDVNPQISSLVGGATEAARAVITTFENALNQASAALSAEVSGLSLTFSTLQQPGGLGPANASGLMWTRRSAGLSRGAPADEGSAAPDRSGTSTRRATVVTPAVQAMQGKVLGASSQVLDLPVGPIARVLDDTVAHQGSAAPDRSGTSTRRAMVVTPAVQAMQGKVLGASSQVDLPTGRVADVDGRTPLAVELPERRILRVLDDTVE